MGVDASYLYGYGSDVDKLEWDIEFLKEKYKDKMQEKINPEYKYSGNWEYFITNLEQSIENDESLGETLESLSNTLIEIHWEDETYLTFNHQHIAKLFPDTKLKDLDEVAKVYAKELGIKNVEVIEWIEWGYFS